MSRALVLMLSLPLLAACESGTSEQRAVAWGAEESQACAARLERDPTYAVLVSHIPLAGQAATALQRADPALPDQTQRAALRMWKRDLGLCREPTLRAAAVFAPGAVAVLRRNYPRSDAVIDRLIEGRVTWGAANRERDAIGAEFEQALGPAATTPVPETGPISLSLRRMGL